MATGIRINYIRIPAVCFWMHIVLVSIRFYAKVQKCAEYVFSEYSSLDKLYNKTIVPILNGEVSLPDVGADWIFIDLALCKIVNPSNFHKLKQIILSHVRKMYMCKEPNILYYYDNLEDILQHLEYTQL